METNPSDIPWHVMYGRYATPRVIHELQRLHTDTTLPWRLHDFFVPLQTVSGRERLAPGSYIFLRATLHDIQAMRTGSLLSTDIRHVRSSAGKPMTIEAHDVDNFRHVLHLLRSEARIEPIPATPHVGDHIRVLRGPFAGVEGTLRSCRGHKTCTVNVTLGRLLSVPILTLSLDDVQYLDLPSVSRNYKRIHDFLSIAEDSLLRRRQLTPEDIIHLQHLVDQYSAVTLSGKLRHTHAQAMCYALQALGQGDTTVYLKYHDILKE